MRKILGLISLLLLSCAAFAQIHTGGGSSSSGGSVNSGTAGQPAVYTGTNSIGSSPVYLDASQFAGATVDVKVNACITAAIAAHATCDARALAGNQSVAAQINVGDSSGDEVTLLLPAKGSWQATSAMSDGTSCMLKQYPNTTIIGSASGGISNDFNLNAASAVSLGYVYCTAATSSLYYFHAEGFGVYVPTGANATANNVGFYINGAADGSIWQNILVEDHVDTTVALADGVCCGATIRNSRFEAAQLGGIPLKITLSNTSTLIHAQGMILSGVSLNHPASTNPALKIADTDTNHVLTVEATDLYTETSNTDTTTTLYQIDGARAVNFDHLNFHSQVASNTSAFVSVTNAYATLLTVSGASAGLGLGTWTYPVNAVVNNFTSETLATDANGNFGFYSSNNAFVHNLSYASSVAGLASFSPYFMSGALFTGGSGTTTFPLIYWNCGGSTAPTAFSTSGTVLGMNSCNSFVGRFLDFYNNSSEKFNVSNSGTVFAAGSLTTNGNLSFTSGKGQHITPQASNNDVSGTFSVSASTTASVTFTTNYTSTPVCTLTPQTTGLTSWYLSAISNSGFTVTVAPSGSYTFGYHCIGNPN